MFAIITRRKLLDVLYFSILVGVLYYYSSHLSLPRISIRNLPLRGHRQHERNFSVPHYSDHDDIQEDVQVISRNLHTQILHTEPPAGFAAFSRLYVFNGTLFAVVADRKTKKTYPALRYLISRPVPPGKSQGNEPTNKVSILSTCINYAEVWFSKEMRLLTVQEALHTLGPLEDAVLIPGFTLILNDVNQYMGVSNSYFFFDISNPYTRNFSITTTGGVR